MKMRKLELLFRDIPVGTRCTGTVHFFALNVSELLKRNIIRADKTSVDGVPGYDYVFCGIKDWNEVKRERRRDERSDRDRTDEFD